MAEYDVVIGFRVYRYDTVLRSMRLVDLQPDRRVLFRVRVRDVDCAFKLFRREVIEKITIESDDFFVDTELVAKARQWNFRIAREGRAPLPADGGRDDRPGQRHSADAADDRDDVAAHPRARPVADAREPARGRVGPGGTVESTPPP